MTEPNHAPKPSFLFDTSPLSTLCSFPLTGALYIHTILDYAGIVLTDSVASEIQAATKGKIARTVLPLIKAGRITVLKAHTSPAIVDAAYGKDLGIGERSTIRAALVIGLPVIMDDKTAFLVACRFGLRPIGFQDFIVKLVRDQGLPKQTAMEIVQGTARQYPAMYLTHTLDMLS